MDNIQPANIENQLMPRPTLREPHFRKYERVLGQIARTREVDIDPTPLLASSYIVGLKEALRGYSLHGYRSAYIPSGYVFNVRLLAFGELPNGHVGVVNKSLAAQLAIKSAPGEVLDGEGPGWLANEDMLNSLRDQRQPAVLRFRCTPGQESALIARLDAADWVGTILEPGLVRADLHIS